MSLSDLSHDEMRRALSELDQALFHHEQWRDELNRTLICGLSPDRRDLEADAHRNCRFGQWLYRAGAESLASHPAFSQIETLHRQLHDGARHLLSTSSSGERIAIEDYERFVNVLKQMHLEMLTTKHEIEDAIYNLDPLTGAASRIGMLTKLREHLALVQRKAEVCCLVMMDVDNFKAVNDTHGHTAGDQVLTTFAHNLKTQLRSYDMVFRYGGEEFLICLPNVDTETAHGIIDRVCAVLAALEFDGEGTSTYNVTASFGLTLLDPDVSVEASIERADKALYEAKAAGRNRVVVWDVSMSHQTGDAVALAAKAE